MMFKTRKTLTAIAVAIAGTHAVADTQAESKGFIEDSSLSLLARNFYFNRDFRDVDQDDQSYREEWGQGFMTYFESGFTQGTVGFGFDAHGLLGLKLDSGRGRSGTGLLPVDSNDRAEDAYSEAGGAIKARISSTTLRYGEMQTTAPVFATSDSRLLPETATGILITSEESDGLMVEAGHFTAYNYRNSSNSDDDMLLDVGEGRLGKVVDFAGGTYNLSEELTASLYASEFEDTWRQYYTNLNYTIPLSEEQSLNFDFNLYRTSDTGDSYQGDIDTTIYSLAAEYSVGAHAFTFAYQENDGDTSFDYVGGDSVILANAVSYSDFKGANERSYQARYDLDFSSYGVPGLSFATRYIMGEKIDGTDADPVGGYAGLQGADGEHWERDFDAKYVIQSGSAKDLSIRLRQATHRSNDAQGEDDIDEVRVIIEYPLEIM